MVTVMVGARARARVGLTARVEARGESGDGSSDGRRAFVVSTAK